MQVPQGTRLHLPVGVKRNTPGLSFTEIDASGMAHHKVADEHWTPLPTRPDRDPLVRYLFPPSTGATLNLAATAAQCARIWRTIDPAFAARCLTAAEGIHQLPSSLSDAVDQMERSELLAETLGEHVFEWFIRNKRAEWVDYKTQVTQFELDRYLPRL